jgi:hypothetical protein
MVHPRDWGDDRTASQQFASRLAPPLPFPTSSCLSDSLPKSRQATTCSGSGIPPKTKKELLTAIREMDAELRSGHHPAAHDRALDIAVAKSEAMALLARADAGRVGWPAKPKSDEDVLRLAFYVMGCRSRRDWLLFDAAALAERIRFLSRFLKHSNPMVQLANRNAGSS